MSGPVDSAQPNKTLPDPPKRAQKLGPLHKVEFVIEVVGPKSIPAAAAAALLRPQWYTALGAPRLWAMSPSDVEWQILTDNQLGSYDSLALTWSYIGPAGELTSRSVLQLAQTAEQFAASVQRRALTLPPPGEIDNSVRSVRDIIQRLDIGVSVAVVFVESVPEQAIWQAASDLGLSLNTSGEFVWGATAQLTVIPLDEPCLFSLGSLKGGRNHEGITIGFSIPQVANPIVSLQTAFQVGDAFARQFRGLVISDENAPLTEEVRQQYLENLRMALQAFDQVGLDPGSAEALRLFKNE